MRPEIKAMSRLEVNMRSEFRSEQSPTELARD